MEADPLIEEFMYSIKSKESQITYKKYMNYFFNFSGLKTMELLKLPVQDIQKLLIKYIINMRNNNLSYSSIMGRVSPLFSFLELNDIIVNKKKISRFFGEHIKQKDFAYSIDDIEKMLSVCDLRRKLIILIYASTGIRKSALIDIKLKHLKRIDDLYQFTIYEGTNYEYITYCTPETARVIDEYIEFRKNAGEKVTKESYLVRNHFDVKHYNRARDPKQVHPDALMTTVLRILHACGLRETGHPQFQRHEKVVFHAFRKFFNTTLVNANVNSIVKELLMGHSIGLDNSYLRMSDDKILQEYLKAVNDLTIDDAFKWKRKWEQSKIDNSILKKHDKEIREFKQFIKNLH